MAAALVTTGKAFLAAALGVVAMHVPVIVVEGLVTGSVLVFLRTVRPEVLES
jgi:cobalt/nickel transport system permease protein